VRSRWNDAQAPQDPVESLVYSSRLIGQETSLVLWGGGNTSLKGTARDFRGREQRVMFIKASGADLKDADRRFYPPVRLDDIEAALSRERMDVREMVDYVTHCLVEPASPRPSIETLLHGFLPYPAIHHSHADAILALADNERAAELVGEIFGEEVFLVPYVIPGFELSRLTAELARTHPRAIGCVLTHHGLISWGVDCKQSYERHLDLVTRAEEHIASRLRRDAAADALPDHERARLAAMAATTLRGLLLRGSRRGVVLTDFSDETLAFLARPDAGRLSQAGAATPDHMLNTKRAPLFVDWEPATGEQELFRRLADGVDAYRRHYIAYVKRFNPSGEPMRDPPPRVIQVRGLGLFGAGPDLRSATASFEIALHTHWIQRAAEAIGRYKSLELADAYEAEYFPPELDKLKLAPPAREFGGKVALVTGAGRGIGKAIANRLAEDGALVCVTDVDEVAAEQAAAEIPGAVGLRLDVTDEEQVVRAFEELALRWGGVDIVVSNAGVIVAGAVAGLSLADWQKSLDVNTTGHFLVSRQAVRLMTRQGLGGAIIFNVTKNVLVPGKELGAYSAAKAAAGQLAKVLAIEHGGDGIRVNVVHPDAVFTDLWTPETRASRARAYGVPVEKLEDYYRERTLLKQNVLPEDVAEAVAFLASERSSKSTGNMLVIDAGARDAFPR
jgi:rhamnulose-1-phosphate aldolase/alcohol dehydrogenase